MKKEQPPYSAHRLLQWFCKPSLFEEISGDLQEEFSKRLETKGILRARIYYWLQVISFFRPFAISLKINLFNMVLFKNHALVAFRMMVRHKLFTSINVFGLTLSMIIGLVLITVIMDQKSFDKFHEKGDRIYRITTRSQYKSFGLHRLATTTLPLADEISRDHIEEIVRIRRSLYTDLTSVEENKTLPVGGHYADDNFFNVFSFEFLLGDPNTALKDPFSLVLTEKLAKKIYNKVDVLGETVALKDLGEFTITGVLQDLPRRSHMQFELLASFATVEVLDNKGILSSGINNWRNYSSNYLYFLLEEGGNLQAIQSEMDQIANHQYDQFQDLNADFQIQPLSKIALGTDMINQIGPTTEKEFIIGISILAFIIFLAAIFNYTNLSVARSLKRSREVGIRKVMGSTRANIVSQFVLESVIIALLALGLAMIIFEGVKPALLPYMPNSFISLELTPQILMVFLAFALLAGLISGIIPSLIMSGINISEILKQNSASGLMRRINFRKGVLVFQFTLSMVFIVVAIVAWRQYSFGINYDTGFKKENIYNVYLQGNDHEVAAAKFKQLPEVEDISFSEFVLASGTVNNNWIKLDDPYDSMLVNRMRVDENYAELHEIQLVAGRQFSPTGSKQVLVNQHILDYFKVSDPQDALGRKLITSDGHEMEIVGVTVNFFTDDVGRKQGGFYLYYDPGNNYGVVNMAVNYSDPKVLKSKIESVWNDMDKGIHDFTGDFFIEQLKDSYSGLTFIMKFVGTLAFLVISIASLGLLGIVIYSVEQRIKEIGIRKTMGAGELKIIRLLSSNFFKLIFIAGGVALVISYFFVFQVILPQMVDKPDIGIPEFVLAFIILLIPSVTVILPTVISASRTNPAIVLRNE